MRFYFNPLTTHLAPIGFDGNLQAAHFEPGLVATRGGFTPMLLADEKFRATFVRTLARIAGDMADGSVAKWARPMEVELIPQLQEGLGLPGWRLTGGVTLRMATIKISHSKFIGNRSEDALNMVRSRFELDDVEFHDAVSDALDADFSDGTIRGGLFSQIGGDGIDVSGALIEVDGTRLIDIADKAISVGEASRLTARNVTIERVGTGVASKDASQFRFENSSVTDALTAGVSVYTKKPEYGPAQAVLENVDMRSVGTDVLVQIGNHATVDGVVALEKPFDTETLY
jgi:hypothetical protein